MPAVVTRGCRGAVLTTKVPSRHRCILSAVVAMGSCCHGVLPGVVSAQVGLHTAQWRLQGEHSVVLDWRWRGLYAATVSRCCALAGVAWLWSDYCTVLLCSPGHQACQALPSTWIAALSCILRLRDSCWQDRRKTNIAC